MLLELIGFALATYGVTFVTWRAWKHMKLRAILNKIPGSDGIPFLGDALTLKFDSLGFYNQVFDFCRGNAAEGIAKFWMGPGAWVLVFKADTVKELLNSSRHIAKGSVYRFLHEWLGEGLITSFGDKWFARRRMITPTFHFKILEEFMHVFNEHSTTLVEHLDKVAEGPAFDMSPYTHYHALNIICEAAMGVKINAFDMKGGVGEKYVQAVYSEGDVTLRRMRFPWLWPRFLFNLSPTGRQNAINIPILRNFSAKVIKERKAERAAEQNGAAAGAAAGAAGGGKQSEQNGHLPVQNGAATGGAGGAAGAGGKQSEQNGHLPVQNGAAGAGGKKRRRLALLDMLLEQAANDPQSLDDAGIQEEVDTFMFAGHDTTGSGILFLLLLLGCYPEEQTKVQQEIDRVLEADREVTVEDMNELKYLDCFVKETLRLFPPAPWYSRTTSEPCTIAGYEIPKGVEVLVFTQMLHRDPVYFPDPEKFDPDRWLTDDMAARHPFCYVPFSAGIRNCIGQRFAMLELKTTACYILRKFNIRCPLKHTEIISYATQILKPASPVPVTIHRRD